MRRLLSHETKIVELMLEGHSTCKRPLPDQVNNVWTHPDSAVPGPIIVNRSFTNYFCDGIPRSGLRLIDCELCLPVTIGHEMFLVEDRNVEQLAYMEFVSSGLPGRSVLLPYACATVEFLRSLESAGSFHSGVSVRIVDELAAHFIEECVADTHVHRTLAHVRLLVVKSIICFYLSTSETLLMEEPETLAVQESDNGRAQHLSVREEIAIEGWLDSKSGQPLNEPEQADRDPE